MANQKKTMQNKKTSNLVDLQNVTVDTGLPKEKRVKSFLLQTSPYRFKVDDLVVNVNFVGDETLEEKFKKLFI